ncbi:MAG TPA: two-component regulator propeller domain-containing protein, partial [Candidatus Hydrogenedentes bacterium]|nr:two-component regulator propeller domain-containing protein [Candidatus Hydrogenedentota bacterium]
MNIFRFVIIACLSLLQGPVFAEGSWLPEDFTLFNLTDPFFPTPGKIIPIPTGSFPEHVRGRVETSAEWATAEVIRIDDGGVIYAARPTDTVDGKPVTASAVQGGVTWLGTPEGLYCRTEAGISRHNAYGTGGPLATQITGLASDSRGTIWVGTPLGLSLRTTDGAWSHIRGAQGLPVEDITALALDRSDHIWIGTSQGAILYKPYEEGRQWFYRAGKRYLPGDAIKSIAVVPDGSPVYFLTDAGPGRLD